MDPAILILIILLILNLFLVLWLIFRPQSESNTDSVAQLESTLLLLKSELLKQQAESQLSIKESLESGNRLLDNRMSENSSAIDRRLAVFGQIEQQLGHLKVQASSIESLGQNVESLADLLKPPKLRGNLGELFLEQLLAQILPAEMYSTQFQFPGGQRVDAVVKLGEKVLPIDSKFPLESYNRLSENGTEIAFKEFNTALKKEIDSIADKYLQPENGTTDIAIMYIPSEAVYHQLISKESIDSFTYALRRKVIPSSPGHLYGFLASLSSLYRQFAGNIDQGKLLAILDSLAETMKALEEHFDRIEGSTRSIVTRLSRARQDNAKMVSSIDKARSTSFNIEETIEITGQSEDN